MSTEEYIQSLQRMAAELQSGNALRIAAQTVHADRVERIFDKGTVARGYNKTNPVWIENKYVRGGAKNRGKTGRAQKTSYFKSYDAFKNAIGFSSEVNFRVTNDLQMDFANSKVNPQSSAADSGEVIKKSNTLYVEELRSDDNVKKLEGNEKRFGKFTDFTANERKKFNDILEQELIKALRKL